jgi:hypothetical protein
MASVISFRNRTPSPTQTTASQPTPTPVVASVPTAAKTVVAEPAPIANPTSPATSVAEAPAQTTATLAINANGQIVALNDDEYAGIGGFEGEFSAKDMRVPYLSICGPSSESFKEDQSRIGQFVLKAGEFLPFGETIRVVFFRATKRHREDLPYDPTSNVVAKTWATRAEYLADGFNDSKVKDYADLDLLIEVDGNLEGVDELADLFIGEGANAKAYFLARYSVQSTAYGKLVPTLMGDMKGFLKGNLVNGYYDLTTTKGTGKNLYFYPTPKTAGPTSVELRRAIVARVAPPVASVA